MDASQTAGVFPIHMERQHISVVCFTGHKSLMGPQGTGGLCVGEGVEIRPFAVGGTGVQSFSETQPEEYPTRLEAGTLNSHGLAGLGAALDFLNATGPETIRAHEDALARRFYAGVRCLPGVRVYGNFDAPQRAAIVALNIGEEDSSEISDQLAERFFIATRPGAHCAPGSIAALGPRIRGLSASPGPGSTPWRRPMRPSRRWPRLRRRPADMRQKSERCVITFPTTTAAMEMESACRAAGLPGRLIPVPRSITAGCGLCWAAPPESRAELEELVMAKGVQIDGIYAVLM